MPLDAPRFWSAKPGKSRRAKLLAPLGALYNAAVQHRLRTAAPYRAGCPVVCVGNATVGGVGKTPFVRMLARMLEAEGGAPHILTRGYGGSAKGPLLVERGADPAFVGDEPLMLAQDFPVWVSRDRPAGAKAACEAGAHIIVMDDGFQNPSLVKDVSFLLVDAATLFGNCEVFPAGPLREKPQAALARANAVVAILPSADARMPGALRSYAGKTPLLRAWFEIDAASVPEEPVIAFCGIGRPERFLRSLQEAEADLLDYVAFPDHHPYTEADLEDLWAKANRLGARLVTTEKDFARLAPAARDGITPVTGAMRLRDPARLLGLIGERL